VNLGVQVSWWWCAFQQLVVESLVVSLAMVVLDVLVNYLPQVAFTQQDDSVETFFLDRAHEPFRVGIQIGLLGGSLIGWTPLPLRISPKAPVNSGSRS